MMAISSYLGCIILAVLFLRFLFRFIENNGIPLNWPIIGMTPTLLFNLNRSHEKIAEILNISNGTQPYKGIWFTNTNFVLTSFPENVRYITSTNSWAYVKGPEWLKQFDIFGEALFNSDGDVWRHHRRVFHSFMNHKQFHHSVSKLIPDCIENRLVKVLEHVSERELVVDFQDLFVRHAFDIACKMATGIDSQLVSVEFPETRFHNAMNDAWEAAFYRYVMPDFVWKLQSWLGVGMEKKRSLAWEVLDELLVEFISIQREKCNNNNVDEDDVGFSLLECYLTGHEVTGPTPTDSVMKGNLTNFLLATEDSNSTALTWFFYLLSNHPRVVTKIRDEVKKNLSFKQVGDLQLLSALNEELNQLVYLHAAIYETLRLYPPIPFEFRSATKQDVLPSGHRVDPDMRLLISIHAMGRMKFLWGEDCNEFKPERWITDEGRLKREDPSKFSAFLLGPTVCLGKNLAHFIMKATAATILHNYDVHVIKGQKVAAKNSVIYRMKHGLKVKITKRSWKN